MMVVGVSVMARGDDDPELGNIDQLAAPDAKAAEQTPATQLAAAEKLSTKAARMCKQQTDMLNGARRAKDIIQATCVDDKLTQCNAHAESLAERVKALKAALAAGDSDRAAHESKLIGVLGDKFDVLGQAANQCVGQDIFNTGSMEVEMEVDSDSPDEDPSAIPPVPTSATPFIPPPLSGMS